MKKNVNYFSGTRLSYDALVVRSTSIIQNAEQDTIILSSMGVTPEFLTNFKEQVTALAGLKKHRAVVSLKALTTAERNNTIDDIFVDYKRIVSQLFLVFSADVEEHKAILKKGLSDLKPMELVAAASNLLTVLKETDENIALYGVTPERIASFEALITELKNDASVLQIKTEGVSVEAQKRNELKLEVAKMLEFVSRIGKAYWTKADKANYNRYVIHKPKSPPVVEAPASNGNTAPQADTQISASEF